MSFKFNWGAFPTEFNNEALDMLTKALNKEGSARPPNLVGPIIAKELDLGSKPPQLDILEISELEEDRFRAMFRMRYEGDGYLVLKTKVQANPLMVPNTELPTVPEIGMVAAAQPLVVPMLLRISGLKLHGIIVLAASKQDGMTLVFRSDPLVSVEVHSTFDSVPSVRRMLQREIEATLRNLFQEDLPVIVHDISVNEIKRARERKERQRRILIEKEQMRIRRQHSGSAIPTNDMWSASQGVSGLGSVASPTKSTTSQQLMASQLHQRLMELSRDEGLRRLVTDRNELDLLGVNGNGKYGFNIVSAGTTPRRSMDCADELKYQDVPRSIIFDQNYAHGLNHPPAFDGLSRRASLHLDGLPTDYNALGGMRMTGDPELLEQFIDDDWERQRHSMEVATYLRRREEQRERETSRNGVILRPSDNAIAARLASLMSMGQTLSPYTRRFEHTTMRADVNQRTSYLSNNMLRSHSLGISMPAPQDDPSYPLSNRPSPTHMGLAHSLSLENDGRYIFASASSASIPGLTIPVHNRSDSAAIISPVSLTPGTSFSISSTPHMGRASFPRNRKLRRKVHRIKRTQPSSSKNPT